MVVSKTLLFLQKFDIQLKFEKRPQVRKYVENMHLEALTLTAWSFQRDFRARRSSGIAMAWKSTKGGSIIKWTASVKLENLRQY